MDPEASNSDNIKNDTLTTNEVSKYCNKSSSSLLHRIINELIEENDKPKIAVPVEDYLKRAARLTGLHINRIEDLSTNDDKVMQPDEINRKIIHYELMDYYLTERTKPSCIDLFNKISMKLKIFDDIETFQRNLVKMGYIFEKNGIGGTIIVENPKAKFERYLYLKNINKFRNDSRPIYFMGEIAISSDGKVLNIDESMQLQEHITQLRIMYMVAVKDGVWYCSEVDKFGVEEFRNMTSKLICKLEQPSIIVFDNAVHHCQTFSVVPKNKESLKDEIIEWLRYKNIPCNYAMSKLQLWKLVEMYTDIYENVFLIDNFLKASGHTVLRLPDCINDLTLAAGVRHFISRNIGPVENLAGIRIKLKTLWKPNNEEIIQYNEALVLEEKKLLDLEIKLEEVWDDLMETKIEELRTCIKEEQC